MPRLICLDTYYPQFLETLRLNPASNYESSLKETLSRCFGTGDFYTRNLNALGWTTMDVIVNFEALQDKWAQEHGYASDIIEAQIEAFRPEVIFLQDVGYFDVARLEEWRKRCKLAGQISCPLPPTDNINCMDALFSSLPHHVARFKELGVASYYLPLAFDPIVLERLNHRDNRIQQHGRIHDVVFIGGVGAPSHWKHGMETLNAVAEAIPTFKWWGYGVDLLPDVPLKQKWQGEAFGLAMYEILLQSKICLNRHGEVAEGYANNMRMFEAAGCGAMLLTEAAPNLSDFFYASEAVSYRSPTEAVDAIDYFLKTKTHRESIAINGQRRTLRDHTYAQRMKVVSETLKGMLCPA